MRCAVALLSSNWSTLALAGMIVGVQPTPEVDVAVLVGEIRVPLGVQYRFKDAARALPPPGHLPVEDAHDREHGAETLCYSYPTSRGFIRLELFDSRFGLHTARISRFPGSSMPCTQIKSDPQFLVGEARYFLTEEPLTAPSGWTSEEKGNTTTFEHEWTYTDPSRPHPLGACYSRGVYIRITREQGATQSISVQNWEEPGC